MIEFVCPGCSRSFCVPDEFAGRKARCKTCGGPIEVPTSGALAVAVAAMAIAAVAPEPSVAQPTESIVPPVAAPPSGDVSAAAPRMSMRMRRLLSDAQQMRQAFEASPFIRVMGQRGEPPEIYEIEYRINGLDRPTRGAPAPRSTHRAEIRLTSDYPRLSPQCKMLTPVFHPNIDASTICVGDHWAAGERLVDLVVRIGEMLAYQAYNIKSPLNAEAAMWADLHGDQLPTDARSLRPGE